MQNVSIQKASELSQGVKAAVEQLLGRPIDADEEVSVIAVPPQHLPPSGNREAVAQKLEAFLNRRAEKTRDVSDEEIEAAVMRPLIMCGTVADKSCPRYQHPCSSQCKSQTPSQGTPSTHHCFTGTRTAFVAVRPAGVGASVLL
jgi:hypothetical protein